MAADAPVPAVDTAPLHPAFERYAKEPVPQADVGSPGKDGVLELAFAPSDDGTVLVRDYATAPFHVSGTLAHDPHPDAATVYVQSPTGGVAQGDRRRMTVEMADGGIGVVSTASATKVQSMRANYGASEVSLSVGTDAHLDYVPEPAILHADSRYCQRLSLDVERGGSAVVADVVVPGRLARGERFAFERYAARVTASGPDGLLFEDATHLAPGAADSGVGGDSAAPGVLGEFDVYGTLFAVAPDRDADALSDRLHDAVSDCEGRAGATALPNDAGVAVRALGHRAEYVQTALWSAWNAARSDLLDAPAPAGRKQ